MEKFQLFRNDYKNIKFSDKPLTKPGSLFTPTDQAFYIPGSSSYGPYLKAKKDSQHSAVYYVAPHKFPEYFAAQILLKLGIIAPKCRIVIGDEILNPVVRYNIGMISIDENEKIDEAELYKIATSPFTTFSPILIKYGSQILLYGTPTGSKWEISYLNSEIFKELTFPLPGACPTTLRNEAIESSIYEEICSKNAHLFPVIASKSIDGFIPMSLVRRNYKNGERYEPYHYNYLAISRV